MGPFSRREFLQRSAILSATVAAVGTDVSIGQAAEKAAANAKGAANDRLRVAVVGARGRGMSHVGGFLGKNNCTIDVVCDCDEASITKAMESITKGQGEAPKFVQDFRKVLDDKNIDVISIATPNHWHATMAVWAMKAGKQVYCEKPLTHNVAEGRIIAETAAKTGKICQTGTQSRSNPGMRAAIEYIQTGKIGKVTLAYASCYKPRKSIGKVEAATAPPKTMDYSLWCGPAKELPVQRKQLHYDWHWTWEYGNGDLGNQGVHEMDKARWGIAKDTLPKSVVSIGGRFGYVDDGETANTQLCMFDYGDVPMVFEVRGLDTKDYKGVKVGNIWFGEKGYVVCPSYSGGAAYDLDGKKLEDFKGGGDQFHFDNFVKAVRENKASVLNCSAKEGHLSASLCHLANISYRLGAETAFDKDISAFDSNKDAKDALGRMLEHLKDNKVDHSKAVGRIGPKLTIDTEKEVFTGGTPDLAKANAMLTREYRKGFDIAQGW